MTFADFLVVIVVNIRQVVGMVQFDSDAIEQLLLHLPGLPVSADLQIQLLPNSPLFCDLLT